MKKTIAAVVLGLVTWIVVASVGNRLIRAGMPGYAEVETTMAFSQPMMLARLVLGAVSSLAAGYVTAWMAGVGRPGAKVLAIVLLALFIPMHIALWAKFPAWYHAVFLVSLVVVTIAGGRLRGLQGAGTPP